MKRPVTARSRVLAAFTLFEVMISLLILSIAILATLALLPVGIKAQQMVRSHIYAASMAMTLINNFHTPVDKLEGVSRLAPRYDGLPGVDSSSTGADPYSGWAGEIRDQLVHSSAFQPNLDQQAGWLGGVLPVPTEIARRLDSDDDQIQQLLDQGGVLYYPDPNFMMGLNQGAAMEKTMQVAPAPEIQKLVFAVTSLPQQNALSSLPSESLPWYEVYPFPPEWIGMQAHGRETRRLVAVGGNEGGAMPLYDTSPGPPSPAGKTYDAGAQSGYWYPQVAGWIGWGSQPTWLCGNNRGGFQSWPATGNWQDQWPNPGSFGPCPNGATYAGLPWSGFHVSGQSVSGGTTGDWSWCLAMLSFDDGGHGRYEPVTFGRPMRPGQEQDTWPGLAPGDPRNNSPVDEPNANDDYLNPKAANAGVSKYFGNGFSHGRNWRFFQSKLGGLWRAGNGVAAANEPTYGLHGSDWAWYCFQRVSGGNDALLSQPRNGVYGAAAPVAYPSDSDPLDNTHPDQFQRSGWLPIRALLANPDFPSYEGLQNIDYMEIHKKPWMPKKWPITYPDYVKVFNNQPIASPGGWMANHTRSPNAGISPDPNDPSEDQEHLNLRNFTWKARAPQTANPPATYEMRCDYRDRAIDLWQAVMPTSAPFNAATDQLRKNPDQAALVKDSEGGTMVDCDRYEYPPSELDKFKVIMPKDLAAADWPPHPAQVLALSYLAHAAMMVTGYAPPFGENIATGSYKGVVDNLRVSWEALNWTYARHNERPENEMSLYCTDDPTTPPAAPGTMGAQWNATMIDPATKPWAYPWPYEGYLFTGAVPAGKVQPWPVSHWVRGQGITKDALVVAEDTPPGGGGATFSKIKLCNDTDHKWLVYPGDELVFQIGYMQWWYKYGKGGENCPNLWCGSMPDIWDQNDTHNVWDGRYDPDAPGWWWAGTSTNTKYPSLQYQCQTFHVFKVEGASTYTEGGGAVPPHVDGASFPTDTANSIYVYVTPALPSYPLQFNDARAVVPQGELDPVALHKGTLVRRVCNPHDLLFARKVYEMCMQWSAAYAAEMPNDLGAPKPANHQTMMDKPLSMFDLFYDAGNGGSSNAAVRTPANLPTAAGHSGKESFYRWMTADNPVPDSWFYPAPPAVGRNALTHFGPGRERSDYFEQMAYNHQLDQPGSGNDRRRFWLTKPFRAFHRARSLTFWSVDWKEYEDSETAPSAPVDLTKHGRYPRPSAAGPGYDALVPSIAWGHSPLLGHPESLYMWTSPERSRRYVDVVGGESAGFLYQGWVGALGQPAPGLHNSPASNVLPTPTSADPPPTDGQPVSADVQLGHWGADRNGNGVLDLGGIPRGARMRAVRVRDFLYYDPVLRLHVGN